MENLFNKPLISNGAMTTNLTSPSVDLSKIVGYCVYAKWTGSPAGAIKLQASLDDTNFVDIQYSEQAISGAGDFMWNVSNAFYDKVRVVFTFSGGTGTLNAQINGKGQDSF